MSSSNKVRGFLSNPIIDEMLETIEKNGGYQDRSETLRGIIREKYNNIQEKGDYEKVN